MNIDFTVSEKGRMILRKEGHMDTRLDLNSWNLFGNTLAVYGEVETVRSVHGDMVAVVIRSSTAQKVVLVDLSRPYVVWEKTAGGAEGFGTPDFVGPEGNLLVIPQTREGLVVGHQTHRTFRVWGE